MQYDAGEKTDTTYVLASISSVKFRHKYILIFTFSLYETVLVLCEKSLSEFSSNLYVLRPPESEKIR